MSRRAATALALLALAACSRGGGKEARARLEARDRAAAALPPAFDFDAPLAALQMTGEDVARRLGSFEWSATIEWTVSRGAESLRTRALERHRLRQLATGDFHLLAEIDPGTWTGAETGKEIVRSGEMTWARARYAPWRERPTDRGRDSRRYRDESFRAAADLLALFGDAAAAEPRGDSTASGRAARRFALVLRRAELPPLPVPPGLPDGKFDEDTARRMLFLSGRIPLALQGEILLDADTGAPLSVKLRGSLGEKGDPLLRADCELDARVTALGGAVAAVAAPKGALPDERKPKGVARALERAGLRKRGEAGPEEPEDEGE